MSSCTRLTCGGFRQDLFPLIVLGGFVQFTVQFTVGAGLRFCDSLTHLSHLPTISDSSLRESQNRKFDPSVSGTTVSFPAVIIGARLVAVDGLIRGGSTESLVLEVRNPDTVNAIAEAAKRQGTTPEAAALELLETAVLAQRPFEQIVEPIAKSFDESGMTEEDLDDLIAQTTKAARKEGDQNK